MGTLTVAPCADPSLKPGPMAGTVGAAINQRKRTLATPNYGYEKRQRELAKKQKKQDKERAKEQRKGDVPEHSGATYVAPGGDQAPAADVPPPAAGN